MVECLYAVPARVQRIPIVSDPREIEREMERWREREIEREMKRWRDG